MKRAFAIVGVVLALLFVRPTEASAGFWAWLQELSGPGPAKGYQFDVRLLCFGPREDPAQAGSKLLKYSSAVTVSVCPTQKTGARFAIGALTRVLTFTDTDASRTPSTRWAGGNKIHATTAEVTLTYRPTNDIKYDFVDLGVAMGQYWFSSDTGLPGGFSKFSGLLVEPLRLEFHPTTAARKHIALLRYVQPVFQFSEVIFPSGFKANAFGPNADPARAAAIPSHLVRSCEFFINIGW